MVVERLFDSNPVERHLELHDGASKLLVNARGQLDMFWTIIDIEGNHNRQQYSSFGYCSIADLEAT